MTQFSLNDREVEIDAPGSTPLIYVLRNELGLKSPKFGCGQELCGACVVLIDGKPSFSCTAELRLVKGRSVVTPEGLAESSGAFRCLRRCFVAMQSIQCGYCASGILVAATALIEGRETIERSDVVAALQPHLCRCGSHNRIIAAVLMAAAQYRSGGAWGDADEP